MHVNPRTLLAALLLTGPFLAACGSTSSDPASGRASGPEADPSTSNSEAPDPVEATTANPRLAISHDGGVMVIDARTLKPLADLPATGFTRLNPAGDGRHVLVSESGGFRALDLGAWSEEHGDHAHHYTGPIADTGVVFEAEEPGHVVPHHGTTALFDDGTGRVQLFDDDELAESAEDGTSPQVDTWQAPEAHHGVAVPLHDQLVVTRGTEETRSGLGIVENGRMTTRYDDCPGVHGEATAAGDVLSFGCENGAVLLRDGRFVPVQAPDDYARIGNQAGHPDSPVLLGDYKVEKDAELERPRRISLIDTRDASLRLVDLGTSYSFRSLERGPDGEALVQGTDGHLHVLDEESGKEIASVPTVRPWREPTDWQKPMPNLFAQGDFVYATDPRTRSLVKVSTDDWKVVKRTTLPSTPNELTGVEG